MPQTYTSVFGNDTVPPSRIAYVAVSLTADTTFEWPETSSATNLMADIMEVTPDAAWVMTMPAANEVSVGRDVLIRNLGAFVITLHDNAGGVIGTVATGEAKYLYITSNSTAAGVWTIFTFGTGTSAADASALAGYGLTATGATLSENTPVVAKTANYTVQPSDRASTLTFSNSGTVTCSLPAAGSLLNGFFLNVSNQGTGTLTIDPSTTETIDGATTKTLAPGESCMIVTDLISWYSIGFGRSTVFQFTKLVLDISAGSPFTLTTAQASNKLIQTIGTATAAVTINVPAVVAVYYIQQSYAGAYNTTYKTAAGTGVTLTNSDRAILYCDGVNVVSAQTASVPAANLSGGVAGAVPYQSAPNVTGFSSAGSLGQLLASGGTGAPTWTTPSYVGYTLTTGSAILPTGTTVQRDGSPAEGYLRYNTDLDQFEGYRNGVWAPVGGGATGGGTDDVFYENSLVVTTNYTLTTGKNAHSVGPITVNGGVAVTVPGGQRWVVA